jgi:hypothetical protein
MSTDFPKYDHLEGVSRCRKVSIEIGTISIVLDSSLDDGKQTFLAEQSAR